MTDQPELRRQAVTLTYDQMVEAVRYEGAYPTRDRPAEAVRSVMAALGRRLTGDERVDLAARLPVEVAAVFAAQVPEAGTVTGWGFVEDLASRTGASLATTRWETGAVLTVVARVAGPALVVRILAALPDGWALLFGQAQLLPPRTSA
ncbi:DUF2267 domain-containing protein [Streptomyces sp. NPDC101733]|uniref:DUF2267 domain-containing protein n=1 Tax=unclassified Streptomyces TaxID=2593676 RepID=UPI003806BCF7